MATHDKFQALIEAHKRLLYKVCRTFGREPADRDDLAQEITAQLWRSFPSFDERAAFSTWMYRIALNVAISYQRRERTRVRYVISDDERLLAEGRLRLLARVDDLVLERRTSTAPRVRRDPDWFVRQILELAG